MLIACPSCQRQLNVPDNAVGKQVRCPAPDCGTIFYVPAAAPPAAVAPAAKPVLRPAVAPPTIPKPATPSTPASSSPFEFTGGVAGPEADFGFTEHTDGGIKGIGLRTRLNRAAGWLNTAAGSMVVYTLFAISILVTSFVMRGVQAWPILIAAACAPFLLLPFPVAIIIGARMLSRTRRWGIALTAAIVSLLIGMFSLLGLIGAAVGLVLSLLGNGRPAGGPESFALVTSCGNLTMLTVVAFTSIFAGIVAMRTLLNAEIKKAFI